MQTLSHRKCFCGGAALLARWHSNFLACFLVTCQRTQPVGASVRVHMTQQVKISGMHASPSSRKRDRKAQQLPGCTTNAWLIWAVSLRDEAAPHCIWFIQMSDMCYTVKAAVLPQLQRPIQSCCNQNQQLLCHDAYSTCTAAARQANTVSSLIQQSCFNLGSNG